MLLIVTELISTRGFWLTTATSDKIGNAIKFPLVEGLMPFESVAPQLPITVRGPATVVKSPGTPLDTIVAKLKSPSRIALSTVISS